MVVLGGGAVSYERGTPVPGRMRRGRPWRRLHPEREFIIDNLLVRIHFIIVKIGWTGLAPREFEFPFPGSLISTFLAGADLIELEGVARVHHLDNAQGFGGAKDL